MATAKGKRPASGKKPAVKKSGGRNTRKTSQKRDEIISKGSIGLLLLGIGIFMLFCLWTPSNAGALLAVRGLVNGTFGVLGWIYTLLLCWLGLQIAFGDRWPLRKSVLLYVALLMVCLSTLFQVFRMDELLSALRSEKYQENFNGFLWKSYEASKNVPMGGGFVGALMGFPMGRYLDIVGSALILFFAVGGLIMLIVKAVAPSSGGRMSEWFEQQREAWYERRGERKAERDAEREERALQAERDAALLVPVPEELWEQEEVPQPKKTVATGRKKAPAPAEEPVYEPVYEPEYEEPAPQPLKPKPAPKRPAPVQKPISATPGQQPKLYIEDILPASYTPFEDAYTEYDVERDKYKNRRKNPDVVPDFIAKRRKQYDEAYGALEADMEPQEYDERGEPEVALYEEPTREYGADDMPWEEVEPLYAPEPDGPKPTRRRKTWIDNPLDYQPTLDPSTRLDRPDWQPPEESQVVETPPEEDYRQPPFSLLEREDGRNRLDTREQDAENARKLEQTLSSFGVEASVIKVVHGPAITRYELQPAPGVKVSKIVGLTDDIALNMAAIGVRIEAPIPGKAAIGIEIANEEVATVHLRDVLESDESIRHPSRLAVALGKDIAGKRILADLARMPHLLIAGATGSGKSVCINTLIASIIYRATPDEVRLILIDPKKVELSVYNGIPHLLVPVVTDAKKANGALSWAVMEMDERYKRFAEVGVRDLRGYNSKRKADEPLMPQIVVIIDELSDLMLVAPGEVEESICRLAQLARACGIHLVIATQRPSVNVITGIIKANIPSRIAFAVSSQVDSRTILDSAGAEKLLGKGDMLYAPSGGGKPMRVQGCFVSDAEVARVAEYVKDRHTTDYSQAVIAALEEVAESAGEADEDLNDASGDVLFEQAVEMAVESGQASISMLQRRLRVGYARAGRLIDEMARRNIIGQAEGAKPREVLITREELNLMFRK